MKRWQKNLGVGRWSGFTSVFTEVVPTKTWGWGTFIGNGEDCELIDRSLLFYVVSTVSLSLSYLLELRYAEQCCEYCFTR